MTEMELMLDIEVTTIPDAVLTKLAQYFSEPLEMLQVPMRMFANRSAVEFVEDGGTWEQAVATFDRHFAPMVATGFASTG
jgi:hypothetical protein